VRLEKIQRGALPLKDQLRVVMTGVVRGIDLQTSTCRRTLHRNGFLWEFVELKDAAGELASNEGLSEADLNRWIATFPIELR